MFLLSYCFIAIFWLNHLMDDCHFNYIKKLIKKREKEALEVGTHRLVCLSWRWVVSCELISSLAHAKYYSCL